jgi:hypothetical protein
VGSKLFSLFQIRWEDLDKIEYILLKHLSLQPSELERLPFFRVEALLQNFKEDNDKENARKKEEEKQQKSQMDANKTKQKPMKQPKMPKMKMPKM